MKAIWLIVVVLALAGCGPKSATLLPPAGAQDGGSEANVGAGQTADEIASTALNDAALDLQPATVRVASFNIQFLGFFKHRDDAALASLLVPYDLIFIQELVSPPGEGTFPDGTAFRADAESAHFFDEMTARGYSYVLSEEDTGTGDNNHNNGSATEWFVAFYRPEAIEPAGALFTGFLADDRTNHDNYERVPYAFGFRACGAVPERVCSEDLVFISVHLNPGGGRADTARRAGEIAAITDWIDTRSGAERDYVVLGDMNLEDCDELADVLPTGFASLNDTCRPTNTNINGPKPYDQVFYRPGDTGGQIDAGSFDVINLIAAMAPQWDPALGAYPGDPYDHGTFRQLYSDHHPVTFTLIVDGIDDD